MDNNQLFYIKLDSKYFVNNFILQTPNNVQVKVIKNYYKIHKNRTKLWIKILKKLDINFKKDSLLVKLI